MIQSGLYNQWSGLKYTTNIIDESNYNDDNNNNLLYTKRTSRFLPVVTCFSEVWRLSATENHANLIASKLWTRHDAGLYCWRLYLEHNRLFDSSHNRYLCAHTPIFRYVTLNKPRMLKTNVGRPTPLITCYQNAITSSWLYLNPCPS